MGGFLGLVVFGQRRPSCQESEADFYGVLGRLYSVDLLRGGVKAIFDGCFCHGSIYSFYHSSAAFKTTAFLEIWGPADIFTLAGDMFLCGIIDDGFSMGEYFAYGWLAAQIFLGVYIELFVCYFFCVLV